MRNADGDIENYGIEQRLSLTFDHFLSDDSIIEMHATYLHSEDQNGQKRIRQPKFEGGVSFASPIRKSNTAFENIPTIYGNLHVKHDMLDTDFSTFETVELDTSVDLNLGLRYMLNNAVEIDISAQNILDRQNQDVLGYPAMPRHLKLSLSRKFF